MEDYLEFLSGFLINNFHDNDVYSDGVENALAYFRKFPEYEEEMENIFKYVFDNEFPENTLRDIVRKDANIFCSTDSYARDWLQHIYDDTILEKDRFQDEKELEELLADLDDGLEIDLENEIQYIPEKMSVEGLRKDILNESLDSEERIKSAVALTKSGDERVIDILLEVLNKKNTEIGFGIVLLLSNYSESKVIDHFIYLLLNDENVDIRQYVASFLGKKTDSTEILSALIEALKQEQEKVVENQIIYCLSKMGSIAIEPLLNLFLENEKFDKIVRRIFSDMPKTMDVATKFIDLLKHENLKIRILASMSLGRFYFKEVLNALKESKTDPDKTVQHYSSMFYSQIFNKIEKNNL